MSTEATGDGKPDTVGAGLDVGVTRHFFLRGEYEYVQFQPVANTPINVNSVRLGAAFKF